MIDRLRTLLDRPLDARHRRSVFFTAVGALALFAAALLLTRPADQPPTQQTTQHRPPAIAEPVPATPTEAKEHRSAPPGSPQAKYPDAPPPDAERAMRTFLDGYLDYLYGHGSAEGIRAAAPPLVRRLASRPPRVSPAQRQREPHVTEIRARGADGPAVALLATIDDGGTSRYPIRALARPHDGGWQITELVSDG